MAPRKKVAKTTEVVEKIKPVEVKEIKRKPILISERKYTLFITTVQNIIVPKEIVKVEVKNLGAGDLYFGFDTVENYSENVILPEEEKIFDNISELKLLSNCRPTVIVRMYK